MEHHEWIFIADTFFLIRFGLFALLSRTAIRRGTFFAPLEGKERVAYIFHQISSLLLILFPLFLKIQTLPPWFWIGLSIYILGIAVLTISIVAVQFSAALVVFIASTHPIILSEERWCAQQFGDEYRSYASRVRRYFSLGLFSTIPQR